MGKVIIKSGSASTSEELQDFTADEKRKLASIEYGAQVNVKADWTATEGDALILNRPSALANPHPLVMDNGVLYDGSERVEVDITKYLYKTVLLFDKIEEGGVELRQKTDADCDSIIYLERMHLFCACLNGLYYADWPGSIDYNDGETSSPFANRIYICNGEIYVWDGERLVSEAAAREAHEADTGNPHSVTAEQLPYTRYTSGDETNVKEELDALDYGVKYSIDTLHTETAARTEADEAMQTAIDTEAAARIAETAARTEADEAMQTAIDTLQSWREDINIERGDNPEFIQVTTDDDGRVVEGIRADGTKYLALPSNQDTLLQEQIEAEAQTREAVVKSSKTSVFHGIVADAEPVSESAVWYEGIYYIESKKRFFAYANNRYYYNWGTCTEYNTGEAPDSTPYADKVYLLGGVTYTWADNSLTAETVRLEKKIDDNVVGIGFDEVTGEVYVINAGDNPAFQGGEIDPETGEVTLTFNYQ